MKRLVLSGTLLLLVLATTAAGHAQSSTLQLPVLPGVRVTVLVDNLSLEPPLKGEWGAAFLLETGPQRILYDTGAGKTLLANAQALGVALRPLDAIVFSHQDEDHTGGLGKVLPVSGPVRLFTHPGVFGTRHWKEGERPSKPFTLPFTRAQLGQQGVTLVETKGPTEIGPGVMVTGEIPRTNTFEDTGLLDRAFLDPEGKAPDPILEDQAVFFRVPEGVVVLLGCGHAGVVNTLDYVCRLLGESRIYAVIGGVHMLFASLERTQQTLRAFQRLKVQQLALSHCTGARAWATFEEALPGRCRYPSVGTRLGFGALAGD